MMSLLIAVRRYGLINGLRYRLIELLAQDMPVLLNVNVCRPDGYKGVLIKFPSEDKPGQIVNCSVWGHEEDAIITPIRDIKVVAPPVVSEGRKY